MIKNFYLFLFCSDSAKDPVAPGVLQASLDIYRPQRSESICLDGRGVWFKQLSDSTVLAFAETMDVPSYMYSTLATDLNTNFSDASLISVVNWHQGANAPRNIFCAHTTADVSEGLFAPASGTELSALLRALEAERKSSSLADWRVLVEASHWSGTMVGCAAQQLLAVKAPVVDLEIGSDEAAWGNVEAQQILARALGRVPEFRRPVLPQVLFCGGMHFEPSLSEGFFCSEFNISHVLPNQWMVAGAYGGEQGATRLGLALDSVREPVDALIFHDGLKGPFKASVRQMASERGLVCANHRLLRDAPKVRDIAKKTEQKIPCQTPLAC